MLKSLHPWQHKLLRVLFGIPEDAEPLQGRHPAFRNRPFKNRPMTGYHNRPRILKNWQTRIGAFIERQIAKRRSR
jgi:hypothetical protein